MLEFRTPHGTQKASHMKTWVARRSSMERCSAFRHSYGPAQSFMNLIDVLIPVALLAGLVRGRKHGISVELIRTLKWIALVIAGAALAPQAGHVISQHGFFEFPTACLMMYLGIALVVFLFFSMLERRLTRRLEKGDAFGHAEYYLGMAAGMVRAACMILMTLSILNYRSFTTTQVHAMEKFQRDEYGSEVFPTLYTFQKSVFQDSLTGAWIKNHLSFLLLDPSPTPAGAPYRRKG
jgi:uncharacterized membrane protein required for colicin V production